MAIKLQSQLITITIKTENLLKLESGLYNRRKNNTIVFFSFHLRICSDQFLYQKLNSSTLSILSWKIDIVHKYSQTLIIHTDTYIHQDLIVG